LRSHPVLIEHPRQMQGWKPGAAEWFFLDYDGTLADFAPTPDDVLPDPALISLLTRLNASPDRRVMVISGRRLAHIQKLLPTPGILLAGSYGLEMQLPDGEALDRMPYEQVRPHLEALKPHWQKLLEGQDSFYLEDKGWSLAIHARHAEDNQAVRVIEAALPLAEQCGDAGSFQILGGHKFLEVCPKLADKGQTIEYLLERYAWPGSNLLYIGDDDKDEKAFAAISEQDGIAIVVAAQPRPSRATYRLASPQAVRHFLTHFIQPSQTGETPA
jgi:trehalose 6-phosphate phosphatase